MIWAVGTFTSNRSFSEITGEMWTQGKCSTIQKLLKSVFLKKPDRHNLKVFYLNSSEKEMYLKDWTVPTALGL